MNLLKKLYSPSPIIIIGCHRSGTSIFTTILKENGCFMGHDTYAHDESFCFLQLNATLLQMAHANWHSPSNFAQNYSLHLDQLYRKAKGTTNTPNFLYKYTGGFNYFASKKALQWGWKDPRSTITLPIWLRLFPNAKILHIYRHGFDVANSIYNREIKRSPTSPVYSENCTTMKGAYKLWQEYENQALAYKQIIPSENYLSIPYEMLLLETGLELNKISSFLDISIDPTKVTLDKKKAFAFKNDQFILNELREMSSDALLTKLGYEQF